MAKVFLKHRLQPEYASVLLLVALPFFLTLPRPSIFLLGPKLPVGPFVKGPFMAREIELELEYVLNGGGRWVRPPPRGPPRTTGQRPKGELKGIFPLALRSRLLLLPFFFCSLRIPQCVCRKGMSRQKTCQTSGPNPQGNHFPIDFYQCFVFLGAVP